MQWTIKVEGGAHWTITKVNESHLDVDIMGRVYTGGTFIEDDQTWQIWDCMGT